MRASIGNGTRSASDAGSMPVTWPTETWVSVNQACSLAITMSASAT